MAHINGNKVLFGNMRQAFIPYDNLLYTPEAPDIPPEVQACIEYYHENYAPQADISDIGYIYGLTYNSGIQQFEYKTLVLYPMTTVPVLNCGGYSNTRMSLWNASQYRTPLYNNIPNSYEYMWSTDPNGTNNPIELYGNFPQIDKYESSFRLNYTYIGG